MSNSRELILVTGATGRQGGAVVRHLLQGSWRLRALTRDAHKPAAVALAEKGVEIMEGTLDDPMAVERAVQGAYGVFSVQNFWEHGAQVEIDQGKRLADAAMRAGVRHFVYSSVGGADRATGIPHFDSKWEIEKHIQAIGLPATVFRPVFFMDNLNAPALKSAILQGTLSMPMRPSKPLQMIAVDDIGAFVAMAFNDPDRFIGTATELAGDELTMPQVADILTRVIGREVRFVEVPLEQEMATSRESGVMFHWFNREGYKADIPALRQMYGGLMTFETWLRHSGWEGLALKQPVGAVA